MPEQLPASPAAAPAPAPAPDSRGAHPTVAARRRRRGALALAGVLTVALGLTIRLALTGAWTGPAGDALYAVAVYVAVGILAPHWRSMSVAGTAFAVCLAVELFQLTGVPARLADAFAPAALVLGRGFDGTDVVLYLVGVGVAGAADAALRARRPAAVEATSRIPSHTGPRNTATR